MRPIIPVHAKVAIMGLPHHGKVKGGKLLYSGGGIKMDYPQVGSSNVLLEQITPLPDRTGNALDVANQYDWKDRLLVQIGGVGTVPAAIPVDHIVFFDAADVAWLVKIEVVIASLTYTVKATLVRQYQLIAESHIADFNYLFFTSSSVDLSAYTASHGLALLTGHQFANQNPRGNKTLIGIGGSFSSPVSLSEVIAQIPELTISGTVDPDTGTGLSGVLSTWKNVGECVEAEYEVSADQDYKVRFLKLQNSRTCTGVPGTGTMTIENEMDPGIPADDQAPPDPNGYYYYDGEVGVTDTQKRAVSAFYDEDGTAKLVEVETRYNSFIFETDTWTYTYDYTQLYNVTTHIPPIAKWTGQGAGTGTLSINEVDTNSDDNGESYAIDLIIDGTVKETVELKTYQHYSEVYTKSSSAPANSSGTYYYECAAWESGWSNRSMISRPRELPDPVAAGYTEEIINTVVYEFINNGSVIWTDTDYRADPPPDFRQMSNRVFGLLIGATLATDAGVTQWFGAHTDSDGIQGEVQEYAAYDPYNTTVETDADPIGFV